MATGRGSHHHIAEGADTAVLGFVEVGKGQQRAVALDHRRALALSDGIAQLRWRQRILGFGEHVEQLVRALGETADSGDVRGLDGAMGQLHKSGSLKEEGDGILHCLAACAGTIAACKIATRILS
ncbi:hypothetical protein D3C84_912310 [compost metagenome]